MTPLLSVIIPTANRLQYLAATVESACDIPDARLEVVVSDTSTTDAEAVLALAQHDPRVRVVHRAPPVSMTDNFNAAVRAATGRYVTIIGDDDGVLPAALDLAAWCDARDVDAAVPTLPARYLWPDFVSRVWGTRHAAKLYVDPYTGCVAELDVEAAFRAFLTSGGQGTQQLPRAYHAVVRRRCLNEVEDRLGAVFIGVSPDIAGAVGLATTVRRAVTVDYPISISGAGGNSNAGRSAAGRHVGDLRDDPHLRPYTNLYWPDVVPAFFSVETVWAQTAVETLERLIPERLHSLNLARLHALCLARHPRYGAAIGRAVAAAARQRGAGHLASVAWELGSVGRGEVARVVRRLARPTPRGHATEYADLPTIRAAAARLQTHMREQSVTWG